MGEPQPDTVYTLEEYYEFELASEIKHEFDNGQILAMSGASVDHNRISRNMVSFLFTNLRSGNNKCESFNSDNRVYIKEMNAVAYPDGFVVCGDIQFQNEKKLAVTNPSLVIEVLSPSSSSYDRGDKFHIYRQLTSLKEYVLISQDKPEVEIYFLSERGIWELMTFIGLDNEAHFRSLDLKIPLREVYYDVDWAQ